MLRVAHSRLAHAYKTAINRTMAIKAVVDIDKLDLQSTRSCSPCVQGTMPNTAMKSRKTLETRPCAVSHTNNVEMSEASIYSARYFVKISNKACGHITAFCMIVNAEVSESLKRLVMSAEIQTEYKVKKIMPDGGR